MEFIIGAFVIAIGALTLEIIGFKNTLLYFILGQVFGIALTLAGVVSIQ